MIVSASVYSDTGGKLGEVSMDVEVIMLEIFGKPAHHTGEWVKIAAGDLEGWVHASTVEAPYGHGGARPNSGPLAGRVSFRPFAHSTKGETISRVSWEFSRCNSCGAIGWEVAESESLWTPGQPEGEGWQDLDSQPDNPLVHAEGCTNR